MTDDGQARPRSIVEAEDVERRAVDAALNYLSYRQRTAREVRRKLAERGFSGETIRLALRRLEAVGLVNDEAFVGAYVRDRIVHRPLGVRRMTRELWMKGVPREVALTVIQQVFDEEGTDERLLAERVIERKLPGLTNPPVEGPRLRRQLRDHLMRRGFDPQLVRELVETCVPDRKDAGSRPARWER